MGVFHQPRCDIDYIADHGIFTPLHTADFAAKHRPRCDADGAVDMKLTQHRLNIQRSVNSANGIIFVGQRRQAQRGQQTYAFIIHRKLVNTALVAINTVLQRSDNRMRLR